MEFAIAGLIFFASQSATQSQVGRRSDAAQAFEACVRVEAVRLEPSGDPLTDVVQAAFVACRDQEADLLFAIIDNRESTRPDEPREQRQDVALRVVNDVKAVIAGEARLAAMRARASRNER